jgi:hypothetical protein
VGADGTVAILALNRSDRYAVLKTYDSLEVAKLAAVPAYAVIDPVLFGLSGR